MFENYNRKKLAILPTPIHKLERLSNYLNGPEIFIKRDDLTGLGLGGNKLRKLEFLIGDAMSKNCDTVITGGAEQSNHCRQTAAAAALAGLECHLILGGNEPHKANGNFLLDLLFNAKIHWTGEYRKGEKIPDISKELGKQGKNVYTIPYGGSNAIGALGYVYAVKELKIQMERYDLDFDTIVFATSSGGTHAGMTIGKRVFNLNPEIYGIKIDKDEIDNLKYKELLQKLCNKISVILNIEPINYNFNVNENFLGEGYGVVGNLEREAVNLCAKLEGIIVDPVYTGRAFGGMIDLVRKKYFKKGQKILFWHTGGFPSVFHYSKELLS